MNPNAAQPDRAGFTLLELILVLVLVAITLAMVAPTLRGFGERRRTQDAATDMLLMMRWARTQAINEARPYRFNVNVDAGEYYLTARNGGRFEAIRGDFGRRVRLPVDVTVDWLEPRHGGEADYLEITPTGAMEPGRFRLVNNDGTAFELRSESAAEAYRIAAVEEGL